ncbi:MAG: hypothetical protein MI749_15260 [Desulfovibrionales bacterium]|nr:hypothetical protein [Desulfovibrionales bacterium]
MPKSTTPTALADHIGSILYPIQAYAEVLQSSGAEHAALAGDVLNSLCDEAEGKITKLSDALEEKFGALAIKSNGAPKVVEGQQ